MISNNLKTDNNNDHSQRSVGYWMKLHSDRLLLSLFRIYFCPTFITLSSLVAMIVVCVWESIFMNLTAIELDSNHFLLDAHPPFIPWQTPFIQKHPLHQEYGPISSGADPGVDPISLGVDPLSSGADPIIQEYTKKKYSESSKPHFCPRSRYHLFRVDPISFHSYPN